MTGFVLLFALVIRGGTEVGAGLVAGWGDAEELGLLVAAAGFFHCSSGWGGWWVDGWMGCE